MLFYQHSLKYSTISCDITALIIKYLNVFVQTLNSDFQKADQLFSIKSFVYSIFDNLISNSIKYRNMGTDPVIHISTEVKSGKISIRYKDNGRGIDTSKYGNELFGLYKKFDTTVEGKGMGLFMVKKQVEELGGTISLHSELQIGTEFVISFPQLLPVVCA